MSTPLGGSFRRLYAATAASDLADGVGRAALPLAAAAFTRNPLLISGLVTFAFLPWLLFALPAGALVDRFDRRVAMAVANAVRALASLVLAALLLTHAGGIVALYAVSFALGVAETVYDSAVRALLPQLVGRGQLDRANGLLTVEETLGQTFAGAPLGSALFGVAVALPFVFDGVGFAIAVVLIVGLRGSFRPERDPVGATSMRAEIAEGVRWLRGHALLRGLTLVSAVQAFASAMATGVLVLYVLEVLRLPSSDFGFVLLAAGVGAIVGGVITPPLSRLVGRAPVLTVGAATSGLACAAMAFTRHGYVAAAFFAVESVGVMTWNVLTMSLRQALIPVELFGRVQGAYRTLVWGGIPLGSIAGGALAGLVGVRWVFAAAGGLLLVMSVVLGRLLRVHRDELADSAGDTVVSVSSSDDADEDARVG